MWRPEDTAKKVAPFHDLNEHDLAYALKYLQYYGRLKADDPVPEVVADSVKTFQADAGIEEDGVIGRQTLEAMWAPRCGCRDDAFTLPAKWRKKNLRWWVDQYLDGVPGLSRSDQDDLHLESFKEFESVIDVDWTRASSRSQADLLIGVGEGSRDQMDGPGGVLAWCQIPPGDDRPIVMKFDKGDLWVRSADFGQRGILFSNVDKHEKGHGHGMLHINGQKALLNAFYSPAVGNLLDADKKALLELGYESAKVAPPSPQPPTGGGTQVVLQVQGKVTSVSVPGFRVIPLQ